MYSSGFHIRYTITKCLWTLAEQWCKTTTKENSMKLHTASRGLSCPTIPARPQNCASAAEPPSAPAFGPNRPARLTKAAAAAPQTAPAELLT